MTCRTCKHRLDVTLWGCWLATGCRIGLVLRDESAKKRNDGRHPDLLRDQYARAREAACSGNIPRVRARRGGLPSNTRARVRLLAQGTFRACARGWYLRRSLADSASDVRTRARGWYPSRYP